MSEAPKAKWYDSLITRVNTFSEELGLDDFSTSKFRDFMFEVAKEQYKRGNKSGVAWAFKKAEENATASS